MIFKKGWEIIIKKFIVKKIYFLKLIINLNCSVEFNIIYQRNSRINIFFLFYRKLKTNQRKTRERFHSNSGEGIPMEPKL